MSSKFEMKNELERLGERAKREEERAVDRVNSRFFKNQLNQFSEYLRVSFVVT